MQKGQWFEGPEWLINKEEWTVQLKLERTQSVSEEHKPEKEEVLYPEEKELDQCDALVDRSTLWRTFRVPRDVTLKRGLIF